MKSIITTTTDILGNKYIALKFDNNDHINDIIDEWVYDLNNSEEEVDKRMLMIQNQIERDKNTHHTTIVSVIECGTINTKDVQIVLGDIVEIELCGIGKAVDNKRGNESHFIVVESKDLDNVRIHFGLKPKDFHITIGFNKKDVFGVSKGKDSIYYTISNINDNDNE